MKAQFFLPAVLGIVLLQSCSVASYYQVYQTTPTETLITEDKKMVYEDQNCKVSYDFWAAGGDIGFYFYNKTDKNIYLNLEECFFVMNGMSYDYYKNRVYSYSNSFGKSTNRGVSSSKSETNIINNVEALTNNIGATNVIGLVTIEQASVTVNEKKVICIPSKTAKYITEYKIYESIYRDCSLFRHPTKKYIKTKSFLYSESPIVFGNIISYSLELSIAPIRFENKFFVSAITNYPENEMYEIGYIEMCGQKTIEPTRKLKNSSAEKFYNKYPYSGSFWKH